MGAGMTDGWSFPRLLVIPGLTGNPQAMGPRFREDDRCGVIPGLTGNPQVMGPRIREDDRWMVIPAKAGIYGPPQARGRRMGGEDDGERRGRQPVLSGQACSQTTGGEGLVGGPVVGQLAMLGHGGAGGV